MRVLVVEDERKLARLVARALEEDRHTVDLAFPDASARASAPSERPRKMNDHAMDATRYALHSERRLGGTSDAVGYYAEWQRWANARLARYDAEATHRDTRNRQLGRGRWWRNLPEVPPPKREQ